VWHDAILESTLVALSGAIQCPSCSLSISRSAGESPNLIHNLFVDKLLELTPRQLFLCVVEGEEAGVQGQSGWLVFWVVIRFKIGVSKGILDSDSLPGTKSKAPLLRRGSEAEVEGQMIGKQKGSYMSSWH
jgi:hypothetical protein